MRKSIVYTIIGLIAVIVATSCNNNTYSNLRDKEDKLIANYLSRNNLQIITDEPGADHVWQEKEYYKVKGYDNLYFHLISRGDSIVIDSIGGEADTTDLAVVANDKVVMRYKQFSLTENADTLSFWTTLDQAYPIEFHYMNTSECECIAWHEAIRLMKYPESQCEIIVPSKLGFSTDQQTVTPYVYILKFKIKQ